MPKLEKIVIFDRNHVKNQRAYRIQEVSDPTLEEQEIFKVLWTKKLRKSENDYFSDKRNCRLFFKINTPVDEKALENLIENVNNEFNKLMEGQFKRNPVGAHEAIVDRYEEFLINDDYFNTDHSKRREKTYLTAKDVLKDSSNINEENLDPKNSKRKAKKRKSMQSHEEKTITYTEFEFLVKRMEDNIKKELEEKVMGELKMLRKDYSEMADKVSIISEEHVNLRKSLEENLESRIERLDSASKRVEESIAKFNKTIKTRSEILDKQYPTKLKKAPLKLPFETDQQIEDFFNSGEENINHLTKKIRKDFPSLQIMNSLRELLSREYKSTHSWNKDNTGRTDYTLVPECFKTWFEKILADDEDCAEAMQGHKRYFTEKLRKHFNTQRTTAKNNGKVIPQKDQKEKNKKGEKKNTGTKDIDETREFDNLSELDRTNSTLTDDDDKVVEVRTDEEQTDEETEGEN